ncbi:MAG: hypothetical protein EX271_12410 [Acidimicrobiales bacterium]|nr:hypothetical protein [Hyphomonadaceae bacterium]RZV36282.1 MAG: hypothetical protein EX271_12410 [Acidimicrobiales bacterium]
MAKEKSIKKTAAGVALSDYVEQVCRQILIGVVSAQRDENLGKYVGRTASKTDYKDLQGNSITMVKFDVAAEISTSIDGAGQINVLAVKADGTVGEARSATNSISFSVPIAIPKPEDQVKVDDERRRKMDQDFDRAVDWKTA